MEFFCHGGGPALVDFLDWIDGGLEFFFGLPIKFAMFFGIQIVEYAVSIFNSFVNLACVPNNKACNLI